MKGSKPLRQAIEQAIKQANRKADGGQSNRMDQSNWQITRTAMSVIRTSTGQAESSDGSPNEGTNQHARIRMEEAPDIYTYLSGGSNPQEVFELRDSWIADTRANVHVCNDRSQLSNFYPVDGEAIRFSNSHAPIIGYGTAKVQGESPNGGVHILELTQVAYIPGCHTNIVSIGLANKKGYFQNQRLQLIEDKEGNPIIRTRKQFQLDIIKYNPISKKERAVFAAAINIRKLMMPFQNKTTTEI
jgi:hypothetical protein